MNAQPNLGMQVTTFENPMGIDGFEFVEFAAPAGRAGELHDMFKRMGFSAVLKHKTRPITVYRQNGVNFLVNEDPDSFAADFAANVSIHEMSMDNGVMRMRELKSGLEIPANGEVQLSPKGYHVMFTGLKQPLKKGDSVKATLTFEHAGTVAVEFAVGGFGDAAPGGGKAQDSMKGMKM